MGGSLVKIGHRGAAGYGPENTLASFQEAIDLGVDMVELDVHVCKSGELVVIHDETLERTTNGQGQVGDKTFAELRALDAGKGQQIPTLEEVIDLVHRRVAVNIELKSAKTGLPVAQLISQYLEDGWDSGHFLVSSSNYEELRRFRMFDQFSRTGLIVGKLSGALFSMSLFDPFELAVNLRCYSIHPRFNFVSRKFVKRAHQVGLMVFPWTVNSSARARRLVQMGVDGIFSDFPDQLLNITKRA